MHVRSEHVRSEHEKQVTKHFPQKKCDQCDNGVIYKRGWNLNRHKASKHFGRVFKCDRCNSAFTNNSYLKIHKRSAHEGFMLKCDACDYNAKTDAQMNDHTRIKHENCSVKNAIFKHFIMYRC